MVKRSAVSDDNIYFFKKVLNMDDCRDTIAPRDDSGMKLIVKKNRANNLNIKEEKHVRI